MDLRAMVLLPHLWVTQSVAPGFHLASSLLTHLPSHHNPSPDLEPCPEHFLLPKGPPLLLRQPLSLTASEILLSIEHISRADC